MEKTLFLVSLNIATALTSLDAQAVTVAIIDTGADTSHQELYQSVWQNPGETGVDSQGRDKATNGIDDDHNGYIDDSRGWNFAGSNADLTDNHGHGTHIAGIIKKTAPNAKLMVIKYFDPKAPGSANMLNLINSVRYAIRMRADIINFSGGGLVANPEEKKVFKEAERQGILVVAAAGNEASNSDKDPFFPADYRLANILSVAAHDSEGTLLPSSNFGTKSVALAAPGLDVLSTMPKGQFGRMSGTSQATAFVTGAAARLLEQRPDWKGHPTALIRHLVTTTRFEPKMRSKTKSSGILDLKRSQALMDRGRTFSGLKILKKSFLDSARLPATRRASNFPIQ